MTKAELIEKLHKSSGKALSKKALTGLVDEVFETVAKAVKKDKRFTYPGFGTFSIRRRAPRVGRNPKTGVEVKIGATRTVVFKPAPNLKSSV
ncbi:MAG: HU family DNA-binding protein [Deltaproteobacteria bacterium]|nr:HU family DNA-binding protein [Deltaproteobacteria bacterium]